MTKPISVIHPEGGEPLYEDASGLRWTAQDFAARHGYATTQDFLKSLEEPKIRIKKVKQEDEING